jgi:hypothetical protein
MINMVVAVIETVVAIIPTTIPVRRAITRVIECMI